MRLLDLFCGAGGASMGYHRAGWTVTGVDIDPQPNYPFEFIQADLTEPFDTAGFDLIHASPPCQVFSTLAAVQDNDYHTRHPDLVEPTRRLLIDSGVPYVIENVPGAPLIEPTTLCGTAFGLTVTSSGIEWELRRHRLFESSVFLWGPPDCSHTRRVLGVYGDLSRNHRPSTRGHKAGHTEAAALMGIDWMTTAELVQALPPAYTEWIGRRLMA